MNRWMYHSDGQLYGEVTLLSQDDVRIDDGEKKTSYSHGNLTLTSHQLVWSNKSKSKTNLALPLRYVVLVEEEDGGFMRTDKIILHLSHTPPNAPTGPCSSSDYDYVRIAFKAGGKQQFCAKLQEALSRRQWEVMAGPKPKPAQRKIRTGIGGIQASLENRARQTDKEISKAFQDLDKLMEMAKPMVALANTISRKIREKQGDISDDETVRFKSYLMSLGIDDPVTRDTHGSGHTYFLQLAKEISHILETPLRECGGMITLTDAFVRVNRARGLELLSAEDLLNACHCLEAAKSNLNLHTFETTGVSVIQLSSADVTNEAMIKKTETSVIEAGSLTAEELARAAGVAVVLAKERLLAAEQVGRLCRDDNVQGLRFYPNLFLTKA